MTKESAQAADFASGKEATLLRIILLKLKNNEFDIILAHGQSLGKTPEEQKISGFTHSEQGHDVVVNKDNQSLQEQLITLLHEILHLMYKYAPENEIEAVGMRLYDELSSEQLDFLLAYFSDLPIWSWYSTPRELH